MNSFTFLFEAMKETHKQRKTKIDIDEFRSRTTNITLSVANEATYMVKANYDYKRRKIN
jgi:hypothetical protein